VIVRTQAKGRQNRRRSSAGSFRSSSLGRFLSSRRSTEGTCRAAISRNWFTSTPLFLEPSEQRLLLGDEPLLEAKHLRAHFGLDESRKLFAARFQFAEEKVLKRLRQLRAERGLDLKLGTLDRARKLRGGLQVPHVLQRLAESVGHGLPAVSGGKRGGELHSFLPHAQTARQTISLQLQPEREPHVGRRDGDRDLVWFSQDAFGLGGSKDTRRRG
jgi:hypothetical protein